MHPEMSDLLNSILRGYFFFTTIGFTFCGKALATSCGVYPSEYAYRGDSVSRAESASANCMRYPPRLGDMGIVYIHCDGEQLKLSDSDRGSNTEYRATSYYVWNTGSADQLLFIFPTRVSLTAITLHYYSDSDRSGLPGLIFFAVPDNFDVWDVITTSILHVDVASVPPGGEPAGRRSVSINVNFDTKKVLIYKFSSSFQLAVSEVEFRCNADAFTTATTTAPTTTTPIPAEISIDTTMYTITTTTTTRGHTGSTEGRIQSSSSMHIQIKWNEIVSWILVAMLSVLLILSLIIHVMQTVWTIRRGRTDRNLNTPPDCTLATVSNPCYEASNVKLYSEVQEAVHIYETLKQ